VCGKLFLELEELRELLDHISHDFSFVNIGFLFRHRLGLGCWLSLSWRSISAWSLKKVSKECNDWAQESLSLLHDASHFVISLFDLNKSFLGLLVKLTPFLDCGNASIGCKENGDRINLQHQ
jgi:hypothetical protein